MAAHATHMRTDLQKRLRAIRFYCDTWLKYGDNQTAFSEWLGIDKKSWHGYETTGNNLPVPVARILKKKVPGLRIEWIYDGEAGLMPLDMVTTLSKLLEAEDMQDAL